MVADFYRVTPEGVLYIRQLFPALLLGQLGGVLEGGVGLRYECAHVYVKLYLGLCIDPEYEVYDLFFFCGPTA